MNKVIVYGGDKGVRVTNGDTVTDVAADTAEQIEYEGALSIAPVGDAAIDAAASGAGDGAVDADAGTGNTTDPQ